MSASPVTNKQIQSEPEPRIALIFAALLLVMFLASLSQTVLSTALPTIVGSLDGADLIMWVITAYLLSSTIMMPIHGRLSDQFGRKPMLLIAIVIFTLGSLLGALAWNMNVLIASRLVQGLGGGGLMVLSQAAIADVVPARERGKYMGLFGSAFAVSSVAGPLLGGWFTEGPGWRWTFWINVPLGILAIVVTAAFLQRAEPRGNKNRSDWAGMAWLALATTMLVLAATWGGSRYDWLSREILALLLLTLIGAAGFVAAERRAAEPVIPLSLFRQRNFNLTTIGSLAVGVGMFGALSYLPTYLQMSMGIDATRSGLMMIAMMGGLLITSVISGVAVTRTGRYRWFPVAGGLVMMAGLYLLSTIKVTTSTWLIELYMAIFGVGIGLGMQIMTLIVQNSFPHAIVGTATAANNYFRQVGATLGSAVVGSVFTSRLINNLSDSMPQSTGGPEASMASLTPETVLALPERLQTIVVHAYNDALMPIFFALVPLLAVAVVASWFVVEEPLARTVETFTTAGETTEN